MKELNYSLKVSNGIELCVDGLIYVLNYPHN